MNLVIITIIILLLVYLLFSGKSCGKMATGGSVRNLMHDELESGSAFNE